jgi:hypothetical protein
MESKVRVNFKVTRQELETLKRVSGRMGMNMSQYLRWVAIDSARLLDEGKFTELSDFMLSTSKVMTTKST